MSINKSVVRRTRYSRARRKTRYCDGTRWCRRDGVFSLGARPNDDKRTFIRPVNFTRFVRTEKSGTTNPHVSSPEISEDEFSYKRKRSFRTVPPVRFSAIPVVPERLRYVDVFIEPIGDAINRSKRTEGERTKFPATFGRRRRDGEFDRSGGGKAIVV